MYTNVMDNRIKDYIENKAQIDTITILNNKYITGKILYGLHLIVSVRRNLYEEGFMNGDVCQVLGETLEGQLVLKRLEDSKEGIINKNDVKSAEWVSYKF